MDESVTTLPYLEGFTTSELYSLAEDYDIEVTPGLGRTSLIEEFLDTVPCLSLYKKEIAVKEADIPEPECLQLLPAKNTSEAPLPGKLPMRFGFTYIDALVRDPFWVYVFWEISAIEKRKIEKYEDFSSYMLRVRLINCKFGSRNLVTSKIKSHNSARYINFPAEYSSGKFCPEGCNSNECSYIVELCAVYKDSERILAVTKPFRMPALLPQPGEKGSKILKAPIMILSGIRDLNIIRNMD